MLNPIQLEGLGKCSKLFRDSPITQCETKHIQVRDVQSGTVHETRTIITFQGKIGLPWWLRQ